MTFVLPNSGVAEIYIVALGFILLCLALFPEVTTAGFFAVEGITSQQFPKFQEVGNTTGTLKRLIEFLSGAGHDDVLPKFSTNLGDSLQGQFQAFLVSCHTAVVPHNLTQFFVEMINCLATLTALGIFQQFGGLILDYR